MFEFKELFPPTPVLVATKETAKASTSTLIGKQEDFHEVEDKFQKLVGVSCFPLESPKLGTKISTKRAKHDSVDSSLNRRGALFKTEYSSKTEQLTASNMMGYL